jgi:hypothetical protein
MDVLELPKTTRAISTADNMTGLQDQNSPDTIALHICRRMRSWIINTVSSP